MSVYRRGNSWYINISIRGHRIHRKAGDSYEEALAIQETLKHKAHTFQIYKRGNIPFDEVAQKFLKHVKSTLSPRTHELYSGDYKIHLKPFFELYFLGDVKNEILLSFQAKQKKKKLSNRTVNIHMTLIRKIMNYAIQNEYIEDPKLKYPMLQEPQKTFMFLTPDENERIMKHFTYDLALKRSLFGYMTGMRPAELAYLSWPDVDFEMNTVKITSKPPLWIIKTKQERVIPLNNTALQILKDLYTKRRSRWVFSNNNKPIKNIRRAIDTAAKKAGIKKKITPNMLRHSFASILLLKGVDIRTVMELMGHTSIETTQRYLHAVNEQLKNAVSLLD